MGMPSRLRSQGRLSAAQDPKPVHQETATALSSLLCVPTQNTEHLRAYFACDVDPRLRELWHARSAPHNDSPQPLAMADAR